ncbi:MAG: nucleotidyltransferase domain-containing protein [Clostridia bacterium]|nr:nucleotidyltransferase domain-containing protein [Clostridia bacterium]
MTTLTTAEEKAITKIINHLVKICPEQLVSVILYGSKARGDFSSDSDLDLLILVKDKTNVNRSRIYDFLVDDEVDYEVNLSLNIYEAGVFKNLVEMNAPFASNVMNEGKILWTN